MDIFNIVYHKAHTSAIEFKTEVDSEYTAHEQRSCLRTNGRRSWSLEFSKTPKNFEDVDIFFCKQKGKFRTFKWKWRKFDDTGKRIGGDDITYMVRFDVDKLDFRINEMGYKTFSIPIVQVMSSE